MSVLPIVTYNDPVLRKKAEPVKELTEEIKELVQDMFDTMYNSDGVGLAAPQIGKSLRIFVMDADGMAEEGDPEYGPLAMINPEIADKFGKKVPMDEGCLSIPKVTDKILRPEGILVKYKDAEFNDQELKLEGWPARVVQHEYDHLEGILFIDYLSAFRKRMHKSSLEEIDSGQRETDYPVVPREKA